PAATEGAASSGSPSVGRGLNWRLLDADVRSDRRGSTWLDQRKAWPGNERRGSRSGEERQDLAARRHVAQRSKKRGSRGRGIVQALDLGSLGIRQRVNGDRRPAPLGALHVGDKAGADEHHGESLKERGAGDEPGHHQALGMGNRGKKQRDGRGEY